jgi:SET domain-containing protein
MKIKQTKFGRGVFSTRSYSVGDLIETSPVIVLSKEDTKKIDETLLYDYYFAWGKNGDQAALALGNGSLFNHSYSPNAKYIKRDSENEINFIALKLIKKGDEILVNYNGNPYSKKPLWFNADPEY